MRKKSEKLNLSELVQLDLDNNSKMELKGGKKSEEEILDGGTLDEIVVTPSKV